MSSSKCAERLPPEERRESALERSPEANGAFDEKAWRRKYMQKYMKEWRKRRKALKQENGK